MTLANEPKLQIENGIYAIAGISKNSGKTSFLNWLLAMLNGRAIGVLTTGRDGEDIDLVYGNPKPAVKLIANTLFSSTSESIDKLGSAVEVLQKLPFLAGTKKLWLLKALRDIETEIVGPANVQAQIQTAEFMQSCGAEIILIDGSLDRKSIALSNQIKGVFLVVGGSFGTLDKINTELTRLIQLSQIHKGKLQAKLQNLNNISYFRDNQWDELGINSLLGNTQDIIAALAEIKPDKIYFPGAVTDSVFNGIKPALKEIKDIFVKHPLQLHLNKSNLDYLVANHGIHAIEPFNIIAVSLNSWSVKGNHLDSCILRDNIRKQFPLVTVVDICEV